MKAQWEKGDIVAAMGGTIENGGKFTPGYSICKIVAVGLSDLAVLSHPARSYDRVYITPQSCCVKISARSISDISSGISQPSIGDLVLGFTSSHSEEMINGILYSIEYTAGLPKSCKILSGQDFVSVPYDRILVLDTKFEQR